MPSGCLRKNCVYTAGGDAERQWSVKGIKKGKIEIIAGRY
jgi:hypothetical protein